MQPDLPDEQLMQRIAWNDTAAFPLSFQRHRRSVFSFTLRMVGDAPAAEDLTQECFLRVWRARFFEGKSMQMTKAELATAVGVSEAEIERALLSLVADKRLRWSKTATGEEMYEIGEGEPHVALIQSLE